MRNTVEQPPALLDLIRRKEVEVKHRLAAGHEAAEARLAEARQRVAQLMAAGEAEGQQAGEAERQAALVQADEDAAALLAQARLEAKTLARAGHAHLEDAVARAVNWVVNGQDPT